MIPSDIKLDLELRRVEYRKQLDPVFFRMVADPWLSANILNLDELQDVIRQIELLGGRCLIASYVQAFCSWQRLPDRTPIMAMLGGSVLMALPRSLEPDWDTVHDSHDPQKDLDNLIRIFWMIGEKIDQRAVTMTLRIAYNCYYTP